MSAHSTGNAQGISILGRIFGPFAEAQTYRNLLYVFLRFPLGVAYFTIFLTMLTVGVVLTPLIVGIPIIALTIAGVSYAGAFEARLARALLDVDIVYTLADLDEVPLKPYLKDAVTNPHNYALLIAAFAALPVGMLSFILLVLVVLFSVAFILAPVLYQLPGVTYGISSITVDGDVIYAVDTLPEALLLSVGGVVVLIASVHVVNLAARVLGQIAVALLDGYGTDDR